MKSKLIAGSIVTLCLIALTIMITLSWVSLSVASDISTQLYRDYLLGTENMLKLVAGAIVLFFISSVFTCACIFGIVQAAKLAWKKLMKMVK